jgi:hypothetical protein
MVVAIVATIRVTSSIEMFQLSLVVAQPSRPGLTHCS